MNAHNLLIAGGGTGGHLFPGIAIAQAFQQKNPMNKILFVGTGRPVEVKVLSASGFSYEKISALGIKGKSLYHKIRAIGVIPKGIWEAIRILRTFKPDVVLGVGGYSSAPVILAAKFLGIRTAIHEQNVLAGITNRLLAHIVDRVYLSFENTRIQCRKHKFCLTGNPVRQSIITAAEAIEKTKINLMAEGKWPFTVVILGGSQGAHSLNRVVVDSLQLVTKNQMVHWIHQTGEQDESWVQQAYSEMGVSSEIKSFFNNMGELYGKADLIIARAGATTVAEISAVRKPAIFIPYPHAADNHQIYNVAGLVDLGVAEMIQESEINAERLSEKMMYYSEHPEVLKEMRHKATQLSHADAAET
ncbi:MAG: undecaprenyldiphospho-muramoylpentapeptide beta-N-acetylglucosaminyltransferase, partial [Desulfobacterales bacterium]|nr:undecaprenyldiphospho-muramoylpentapeptide beta-N-acetylglucosaminyltransferase [Desulfobacterales bacterium]